MQTDLYGPARVDDADEAVALLRGLGPNDAALVKGSRVARLEDVVARYADDTGAVNSVAGRGRSTHGVAGGHRADEDPSRELTVERLGARRR